MSKSKRTINRDSVFRDVNTLDERDAARNLAPVPKQGLPPENTQTHQTAVWLGEDEIKWLETQCRTVQRGGWRGITRSALIRALIRAASEHQVELAGVSGEAEIADRLASKK